MKKTFLPFLIFITTMSLAQVGIGTINPHNSSILDIHSQTKGFLPPRMTEDDINNIQNPAEGLIAYCIDCCSNQGDIKFWDGSEWKGIVQDCTPSIESGLSGTSLVIQNGSNNYITLGTDGNLYAYGDNSTISYLGFGGIPIQSINKKPQLIPNPDGKNFIQITTGQHGGAIALTSEGEVYGSGKPEGGSGTATEVTSFEKLTIGNSSTKALMLATSEGGSMCVADNEKVYVWGYSGGFAGFGSWSNTTPVERNLPTGVVTADIVAIGASWHYIVLATKTKLYYFGNDGVFSPVSLIGWGEINQTFSNIKQLKVSRNIVFIEDDNGFHIRQGTNNHSNLTTINLPTNQNTDIVDIDVFAGDMMTVLTKTNLYLNTINNSSAITQTRTFSVPAGYKSKKVMAGKIGHSNKFIVLLRNETTQSDEYFGATNHTSYQTNHLGNYYTSSQNGGILTSVGFDLSNLATGVQLKW